MTLICPHGHYLKGSAEQLQATPVLLILKNVKKLRMTLICPHGHYLLGAAEQLRATPVLLILKYVK